MARWPTRPDLDGAGRRPPGPASRQPGRLRPTNHLSTDRSAPPGRSVEPPSVLVPPDHRSHRSHDRRTATASLAPSIGRRGRAALRPGVRARRVRHRVRRRCRRNAAGAGPAAGAGRPCGPGPSRGVRGRRCIVRRCRRLAAAGSDRLRGARPPRDLGRRAARRPPALPAPDGSRCARWHRAPARRRGDPRLRAGGDRLARRADESRRAGCGGAGLPASVRPGVHPPPARLGQRRADVGQGVRTAARRSPPTDRVVGTRGRPRRSHRDPVRVLPHDRLQGPRHGCQAPRPVPGPPFDGHPRPVRLVPPALRDEHPTDLAPRPAVPDDRPQRRDQHGPRQPCAGARSRPRSAGCVGDRRRGAHVRGPAVDGGRFRLAVARRDARAARRDGLGSRVGAADRDARGTDPASGTPSARRGAAPADGRVPRTVGRPGRDRVRRRAPGRSDRRSQRPPARRLRGHQGQARRGRERSRRDPAATRGHDPTRPPRPRRALPRRARPRADPRGRRGKGAPAPAPADP